MVHITKRRNPPHVKKEICRVRSVCDGDTLTVEWAKSSWLGFKTEVRPLKVRLAYIDSPEIRYKQAGALQAKALLEKMLQGKRVVVEYEQLPSGGGRRDDYNRMLAVVHVQRTFLPNLNINRLLLKKGLARLYHKPDNITPHHLKKLIRAERHAKRRRLGIWKMSRDQQSVSSTDIVLYIVLGIIVGIVIGLALS
ncbi:MAG: thermonuclease family protein [Candidatus Vecturithrix sp.]|jgi:endonuclease YncB( thermonuclease family)|nr:thermonuclease family protein [Candidatus Vecturithrix sp.]